MIDFIFNFSCSSCGSVTYINIEREPPVMLVGQHRLQCLDSKNLHIVYLMCKPL